jgi:hypothetical protein
MTTIFIHGSAAIAPDAEIHLAHLPDTGHDLVLVAAADHAAVGRLAWPRRIDELPGTPPRGSWYLTADPATCGDRRLGLRTVLIGPREEGPRPTRCDGTARDLRDAVLEILADDAMPE